jgi:hypothetical protein
MGTHFMTCAFEVLMSICLYFFVWALYGHAFHDVFVRVCVCVCVCVRARACLSV